MVTTDPHTSDSAPPKASTDVAIELHHVTKKFIGTEDEVITAVDNLDLTIRKGEVVAFLGPNGAGKSTTIDMVLGLTAPDSGSVAVLGRNPLDTARTGIISAVMQSGGLLGNATVGELIEVFASLWIGSEPRRATERAGLGKLLKRQVSKLSGGEQQRLRFALALLPNPEILVLDEPTAGMDVNARRGFWEAVRDDAARGRTIVFATHYLEEADSFADRIVLINHGKTVADGTTEQIRSTVDGRTISAVLSDMDRARLAAEPLVTEASVRGDRTYFRATDPDAFLARLIADGSATQVEVASHSLEEAFLHLTADERPSDEGSSPIDRRNP